MYYWLNRRPAVRRLANGNRSIVEHCSMNRHVQCLNFGSSTARAEYSELIEALGMITSDALQLPSITHRVSKNLSKIMCEDHLLIANSIWHFLLCARQFRVDILSEASSATRSIDFHCVHSANSLLVCLITSLPALVFLNRVKLSDLLPVSSSLFRNFSFT